MSKFGGSSKPAGRPPETTNDAGQPISFFDTESLLDVPVTRKSGSGTVIGGTVAGIVGGGAAVGYIANENAGEPGLVRIKNSGLWFYSLTVRRFAPRWRHKTRCISPYNRDS